MASDAMGNGPLQGGAGAAPADQQAQGQQLILNAQYVKDLSFENPRAPHSLIQQTRSRRSRSMSTSRRRTSGRTLRGRADDNVERQDRRTRRCFWSSWPMAAS